MDFCAEASIRREFAVPYKPQQNKVAERKNRSIVGATNAMIHDQGLPLFCGQRLATLLFTYRTGVHIVPWGM